jgi:hypothetical protein
MKASSLSMPVVGVNIVRSAPLYRRLVRRLIAVSLVSACSFIGVHKPDKWPASGSVDCSSALPVIDTVAAVAAAGAATFVFAETTGPQDANGIVRVVFGTPPIAIAVITGLSALYGFHDVSSCRDLERAEARRLVDLATNCTEVGRLGDALRQLHAEELLHDPRLASCSCTPAPGVSNCVCVSPMDCKIRPGALSNDPSAASAFWCASSGDGSCWVDEDRCQRAGGGCMRVEEAWCARERDPSRPAAVSTWVGAKRVSPVLRACA